MTPSVPSVGGERSTTGGTRAYALCVTLLLAADIVFLIAFFAGIFETHAWFNEDGPVEDLQALVLFLAGLLSAWQARAERTGGRVILAGLAAVYFACFVRELELRGTGAPDWLVWLFYGTGQNIAIAAIFLAFVAANATRWPTFPEIVRILLAPRTVLYLIAGGVLLLSGVAEGLEKRYGNPAEVIEEWLELNGYILFLLASLHFPYRDLEHRRPGARHPAEIG